MNNFSLRAIFNGILIQIVGSIIISITISTITRLSLSSQGYEEAQIKEFFLVQFESPLFMVAGLIPNFLLAIVAGYVTAKSALKLEYWHALIAISFVAVIYYVPAIGRAPTWFSALSIIGITLFALMGAGIFKKQSVKN